MVITLLVIAGLAIIVGLAFYAWTLVRRVRELKKRQTEELAAAELQIRQHQEELLGDIKFIARAVIAEQCDITEGVMRIRHLIKGLDEDVWQLSELNGIREHFEATSEWPILDAYKALTKQEQFQLDIDRAILEEKNKPTVVREFKWLVDYKFPQITLLQ